METSWKSSYNKAWSIEVLLTEQGRKTKQTQTAALTLSENNILFSAFHFCAKRGRVQRGTRALSRSQTVCQLHALLSPDAPTSASGVCSLRQSKSFSVSFFLTYMRPHCLKSVTVPASSLCSPSFMVFLPFLPLSVLTTVIFRAL